MTQATRRPAQADLGDGPPVGWIRVRRNVMRRVRGAAMEVRDTLLMPVATAGGWLATLYYATVAGAFRREHAAVVRGRARYRREARDASRHFFLLRRNVHRLEKGLVMRPRRETFAADYVEETVDCYVAIANLAERAPEAIDERELRWARDVLTTYFSVVGHGPQIDRARAAFDAAPAPMLAQGTVFAPYRRDIAALPPVGYDDLLALSRQRRSVRWYLQQPVPRELVDRAIEVAVESPSACNRQPFEFRIIDDEALVRQIARIPGGTGGFAGNLPAIAVIVGRLRAFAKERDRHLIYIDGALAAMSFIYALETLGLASCCINWADHAREERAIGRALGIEPDERVVMLVAFGYPDPTGMVPFSAKTPLDVIRRFN